MLAKHYQFNTSVFKSWWPELYLLHDDIMACTHHMMTSWPVLTTWWHHDLYSPHDDIMTCTHHMMMVTSLMTISARHWKNSIMILAWWPICPMMIPKAMQKPITPANRTTNHSVETNRCQCNTSSYFPFCFSFFLPLFTYFFHSQCLCVRLPVSLIPVWVSVYPFYVSLFHYLSLPSLLLSLPLSVSFSPSLASPSLTQYVHSVLELQWSDHFLRLLGGVWRPFRWQCGYYGVVSLRGYHLATERVALSSHEKLHTSP